MHSVFLIFILSSPVVKIEDSVKVLLRMSLQPAACLMIMLSDETYDNGSNHHKRQKQANLTETKLVRVRLPLVTLDQE